MVAGLSSAQLEELPRYRDRWAANQIARHPVDRPAAEAAIRRAYKCAGLAPPQTILWVDGPLELISGSRSHPLAGEPVHNRIVDWVKRQAICRTPLRLDATTISQIQACELSALAIDGRAIDQVLNNAFFELQPPLRSMWRKMTETFRAILPAPEPPLRSHTWTQFYTRWLWPYEFVREVCGIENETEPLTGLIELGRSAGFVHPRERVCWAGERHEHLDTDAAGRLHSGTGPAIRYRDGWHQYYWKGVRVAPWLIENRQLITPPVVDFQTNPLTRRCMIGLLSAEKYITGTAGMHSVRDSAGTLWRKRWHDDDIWTCVEVVNGTPEPDGRFKHYFLEVPNHVQSPVEAVAWTYGMSAREYANIQRRT